jgi:integral membrane sensor domain MASE1
MRGWLIGGAIVGAVLGGFAGMFLLGLAGMESTNNITAGFAWSLVGTCTVIGALVLAAVAAALANLARLLGARRRRG